MPNTSMPTYEYACTACANEWEEIQKISADALDTCPKCGEKTAKRQISGGAFILKGGGWYADAYSSASNKSGKSDKSDKGDKSDKSDSAKSESKSEGKSDGASTSTATTTTKSESTATAAKPTPSSSTPSKT